METFNTKMVDYLENYSIFMHPPVKQGVHIGSVGSVCPSVCLSVCLSVPIGFRAFQDVLYVRLISNLVNLFLVTRLRMGLQIRFLRQRSRSQLL